MPDQEKIDALAKDKKWDQMGPYQTTSKFLEGAKPLAQAIKSELEKPEINIKPPVECNVPTIVLTQHLAGDVVYVFAVNATPDPDDKKDIKNAVKAVEAKLNFRTASPVYDVNEQRLVKPAGKEGAHTLPFGPGQMRVFAVTNTPQQAKLAIKLANPIVNRDLVLDRKPITVDIAATVMADG